jgi:Protein of unknown function (DUF2849)
MHIVSANTVAEGLPVWWTGTAWSHELSQARALAKAEAEAAVAHAAAHDQRQVASVELVDLNRDGTIPRRQRIRALGPGVRPDLRKADVAPLRVAA